MLALLEAAIGAGQPCRQQRIKAFTYADTLQLLAADGAVIIA